VIVIYNNTPRGNLIPFFEPQRDFGILWMICKFIENGSPVSIAEVPTEIQERALRKLRQLNASSTFEDLKIPPSNHLELLSGNRKGQYSIRINKQWRICFQWHNGHAYNVEIVDYH
jgi:proteic killer suppression protein